MGYNPTSGSPPTDFTHKRIQGDGVKTPFQATEPTVMLRPLEILVCQP